ncbi:high frequency lysogenization protein HflD [Rhodospirillaceae bacterium KN72]|uniref:Nickel/cobalt efflux system n=1 Tax=Pacificispira spongiicola TaxID=2729598 RepID=A0A7Y0E2Y2_9PROT|nr:sulfite exporter TauE/SafE family protein [Pacificispira spongiicola]NMM46226.1 high frequency lysogenization protein HflD [Pacificispira spongiicola]
MASFCAAAPVQAQVFGERGGSSGLNWLPDPILHLLAWVAIQQAEFGVALRESVMAMRTGEGIGPASALIGLSFLYGIFHAVGPGHGKAVVASFLMARDSKIRDGIMLSWLIAAVQAVVAIAAVAILGWVLDFGRIALLESMPLVETVSYGLIVLLGAGMIWNTLRGHGCDHDHHGMGHDHDHDHHHHHDTRVERRRSRWEFIATGVASGLRPCTGSLIVLLFTLAAGIYWIGVVSAFAMAVGVSITVSTIGILSILARRGIVHISLESGRAGLVERVPRLLALAGSIAVCLIGLVLLASSLASGVAAL